MVDFIREDWKLFRNMETLCQKAGVPREKMDYLVFKEVTDNALDNDRKVYFGTTDNGFWVENGGEALEPEILEDLFSINRPMKSSKLLRLPTRGALGNGLRVVVGAVLSTNGKLYVSTKGKKYELIPKEDGNTQITNIYDDYECTEGTIIEVCYGEGYTHKRFQEAWGEKAINMSDGKDYKGKTSPYWYTSESFFELCNASVITVEKLATLFEGITKKVVKEYIAPLFGNRLSNELEFYETERLLQLLRENSKFVKAKRLGHIGIEYLDLGEYAKGYGEFTVNSIKGKYHATIPYVVEAWVKPEKSDDTNLEMYVNKTPITGEMYCWKDKGKITFYGCGMTLKFNGIITDYTLNIITPYMPITSDGKEPNFGYMVDGIERTVMKAVRKAKKYIKEQKDSLFSSEKEVIVYNLDEAIAKTSGYGKFKFSQRQLFYAIRPYIISELGKEPDYNYFCRIITEYESQFGYIQGLYRDPRGTLYHPHLQQEIPLGTLAVEDYERPSWTFNKIIYIEKEGFFTMLKEAKFPERYDCALLSSKGYASRAVKDLFDLLGETDEEIQFFCIHDCDSAGTMIYETLVEETLARPGRRVQIYNLGLDPYEALDMGLEVEKVESKRKKPVASYISDHYKNWLQNNRVELNAMTSPQFLEWLEGKMEEYGHIKVVPDKYTLVDELNKNVQTLIEENVKDKILRKYGYNDMVKEEIESLQNNVTVELNELRCKVYSELEENQEQHWSKPIESLAKKIVKNRC